MINRLLIITLFCLLNLSPAIAQPVQYPFSHLDISNGLSHNQVTAIIKDAKGFMWFGTASGLNRYDGYTFKVFRHKENDSTSDRKSTRLNSSHMSISYAVFCLKKKKKKKIKNVMTYI